MNEKCVLISSQNVSQNCLIIRNIQPVDTQKRKAVWCKALAIVIRLQ